MRILDVLARVDGTGIPGHLPILNEADEEACAASAGAIVILE